MPNEMVRSDSGEYDDVTFPDGRRGFVPAGFGAQAQAMINQAAGRNASPGAGTLGTIADGFQAVHEILGAGDMESVLDEVKSLLNRLDLERDAFAAQLDSHSLPPGAATATLGDRWKRIQVLQDRRDYLQERIISTQIRINYGSGIAAAGRGIGRALSPSGGLDGLSSGNLALGAVGIGLGILLLRDRREPDSGTTPRYSGT